MRQPRATARPTDHVPRARTFLPMPLRPALEQLPRIAHGNAMMHIFRTGQFVIHALQVAGVLEMCKTPAQQTQSHCLFRGPKTAAPASLVILEMAV